MRNPFEVYTSTREGKNKRQLDWDESAADTQRGVEGVYDNERSAPKFWWLVAFVTLAVASLVGRLFYLQILHGGDFSVLSEDNRIRKQVVLAPRGKILDRNGDVLAENTASYNLIATPFDLPKAGLNGEVATLAAEFQFDAAAALAKIRATDRNSIQPVIIKQDLTEQQSILFETQGEDFVGFDIQKIPIRDYTQAREFSHLLGYTGLVSPGDLDNVKDPGSYDPNDFIGKLGIESVYENYLHGINGADLVEVDATGKLQDVLGEDRPTPGDTLVLNIDKGLQDQLYQGLQQAIGSQRGAAVAIDPRNGQVLALVSSPGFDTNLFAHGISEADYQKLLDDKTQPLFNRAIAGLYPPGSTSKLMTATAGLQEGVITENTVIVDRGVIRVANQYGGAGYLFHGWNPAGLGPMTVRSAIAMSSDIFFYEVAGGPPDGSWQGLGPDRLAGYFRKFGLGKPTGIDLPGEKGGLVPDPAWKMRYFHNDPLQGKWYLGDTYHMGIGQGDLLVTPLQVAEWTATVANGGVGYVPEVANRAVNQDGRTIWQNQPKVLVSNIASPGVFKIVQEGMRETVVSGTARALSTLPITSAGKTGTSQFDGSDPLKTHAWFTAYAPYENPQIAITVLVEAGGEGNATAEPIVKDALLWWAQNRYKKSQN